MRRSRVTAIGAAVIAAGVLVGGVVAGSFDWSNSTGELDAALVEAHPTRVADIAAVDGLPAHGVFAQLTSTGQLCLSDAPVVAPLQGGGGCNPADDPLSGSVVSASLAYEGGPAIETVSDARLIGLAAQTVASIRVGMSDGSTRSVRLKRARVGPNDLAVFGYRVRMSDLKKGIGPVAVIAYDDHGVEIGRQRTGIG